MKLVLFGPPGVGKGTFAKMLSKKLGIPHISTGEITRDEIDKHTPLGLAVEELISNGQLLSDDIVVALVKERFKEKDVEKGFVLDGFPRTLPQAKAFGGYIHQRGWSLDAVVNIVVDETELIHRIEKRFTCPKCHAIYNLEFWPPHSPGQCDHCGSPLVKRSDETAVAIKKRLQIYRDLTEPVLDYYEAQGIVKQMNGTGKSVEQNFQQLLKLIE